MTKYLDVAIKAAKKGGEILRKYYGNVDVEIKGDNTPVSQADKESEQAIIETIKASFPDHAFYGEEYGEQGENEHVWIIDPLDGTLHFINNIPHFAVLIALMKDGEFIMGVSYDPLNDDVITGEKGEGVSINGAKLSTKTDPAASYCAFEYLVGFERDGLQKELFNLLKGIRGSILLEARAEYEALLTGRVDAMLGAGVGIYDFAPYIVMIEELGGKITDIQGNPPSLESKSFLAANKELHAKLFALMK